MKISKEKYDAMQKEINQLRRKAEMWDGFINAVIDLVKVELSTMVEEEVGSAIDELQISR